MHDFNLLYSLLTIAAVLGVVLSICAGLIFLERKVAAWVQDRHGPNRVGPYGLLQSLADGLKFILKEDIIPTRADKVLYLLAPCLALGTALAAFAVVPFGATTPPPVPPSTNNLRAAQDAALNVDFTSSASPFGGNSPSSAWVGGAIRAAADAQYRQKVEQFERQREQYRTSYQFVVAPGLDIGIVWVFAIGSLAVYGIILGGWAGNNKYSFLGAMRSSAQIISYEIPLGLSALGVVLLAGSLNLERIIHYQADPGGIIHQQAARADGAWPMWNVAYQPLAFLIFMLSAFAECNRLPFDVAEAEQELVGGYHTEYSAMKFAMFFLGEYTHMVTTSFLMVILFFGGWHFPWIAEADSGWFVKLMVLAVKMGCFIFFYMLVRWTIPRFRFDQLMALAWKAMIPLALANLVCVMVVKEFGLSPWLLLPASLALLIAAGYVGSMSDPGVAPRKRLPDIHAPLESATR